MAKATASTPCGSDTACPIHEGFDDAPRGYPLGFPLGDKVDIRTIPFDVAGRIYINHHSYVSTPRTAGTVEHYGVYLDDRIAGAITFAYPLLSEPLRGVESARICEVARVCIAVECPNLASLAMSRAQDRFVEEVAPDEGFDLLVTWIHDDYRGSMFKALRGKGWELDGVSEARNMKSNNRPVSDINQTAKKRFVCPIDPPAREDDSEQAAVDSFF